MSEPVFTATTSDPDPIREGNIRRWMAVPRCANGTPGYSLENGEAYPVRDPCKGTPTPGHIFCPACRVQAGGR
jgi:hypothetical protein